MAVAVIASAAHGQGRETIPVEIVRDLDEYLSGGPRSFKAFAIRRPSSFNECWFSAAVFDKGTAEGAREEALRSCSPSLVEPCSLMALGDWIVDGFPQGLMDQSVAKHEQDPRARLRYNRLPDELVAYRKGGTEAVHALQLPPLPANFVEAYREYRDSPPREFKALAYRPPDPFDQTWLVAASYDQFSAADAVERSVRECSESWRDCRLLAVGPTLAIGMSQEETSSAISKYQGRPSVVFEGRTLPANLEADYRSGRLLEDATLPEIISRFLESVDIGGATRGCIKPDPVTPTTVAAVPASPAADLNATAPPPPAVTFLPPPANVDTDPASWLERSMRALYGPPPSDAFETALALVGRFAKLVPVVGLSMGGSANMVVTVADQDASADDGPAAREIAATVWAHAVVALETGSLDQFYFDYNLLSRISSALASGSGPARSARQLLRVLDALFEGRRGQPEQARLMRSKAAEDGPLPGFARVVLHRSTFAAGFAEDAPAAQDGSRPRRVRLQRVTVPDLVVFGGAEARRWIDPG